MSLSDAVASTAWYHTIDLPGGVVTPGMYDLRRVVGKIPMPASLAGKRCLDVASCDGFWAFEMATRGAAEVVSVDLGDPALRDWQGVASDDDRRQDLGRSQRCFELARDALGIDNVKRRDLSIYDIAPDQLGTFDFVFVGSVLLHLADPVRALRAVRTVTHGEMLSFEHVSLMLSMLTRRLPMATFWRRDQSQWWTPNMAAHRRWLRAAGWTIADSGGPVFQKFGPYHSRRPRLPRNTRDAMWWGGMRWVGAASQWVRATP